VTRRLLALIPLVALCGGVPVIAAPPEPKVDARLATKGDLWQGQRIVIEVTIKTPDTFASAPAFDLPHPPGVILVPPEGSPVLGTESIGDDTFVTQRHELMVFPQVAGDLTVPPFPIRFDSSAGFGKPAQSRKVTTPAVSVNVKRPPGTEGLKLVLTTTSLTIKDSWKPGKPGGDVAPGTAWTRTIFTEASDLPGIVLPAFRVDLPKGLRAYHQPPLVNDQENRGDLTGQRTDTTTFVCQQPGSYEIPAMTVAWWNPDEQKLHRETLPGYSVTVTAPPPGPEASQTASDSESSKQLGWGLGMTLAALAGGVVLFILGPGLRRRWREHRSRVAQSEPALFRNAVKACGSGDPRATYRAILAWRTAIDPAEEELSNESGDGVLNGELASEWSRLERSLYGDQSAGTQSWSPERLSRCLITSLSRWRDHPKASGEKLPQLNP
jgi:hypothetical protein